MKEDLKDYLKNTFNIDEEYNKFTYSEDINEDALSEDWLDNRTSYIYKVGVLTAIDNNKADWVYVVIGVQRGNNSEVEIKGSFYFSEGENDDIGRVINRAIRRLMFMHPVFEEVMDAS